jgi:inosose dehydratase
MNLPSYTRRSALCSLAALGASVALRRSFAAGLPETQAAGQSPQKAESIRLGAQTNAWPIDPRSFDTFLSALSEIRATGYSGFETGFINLRSQAKSLPEARRKIEATGLKFIGVHIFLSEYDAKTNIAPRDLYESVAQAGTAAGAERLIFSGAPAVTPDEIKRKGEALSNAGAYAKTLGLKVAYHNHWPEFKYNGKEIEALYAATDPALVWFLLDAGHAYRTGVDLPGFLRVHQQRITAIHFRDYRDHQQVPLGEGVVPLAQIADVLKQAKWNGWAMNEEEREDGSKQGLKVIQPAFQALKGAFSV